MGIIVLMTRYICDRCKKEMQRETAVDVEASGWHIGYGGSPNEGDAVVFCPECRNLEPLALGHDAAK